MLNKDNLLAITNSVIAKELPHNVRLTRWELENISQAVIKTIVNETNKATFNTFVKGSK
tara:strand:- start:182 stop:358 length:177 start_codon:yes stop_codon:yes gene_type:complete